ncbi:MAG: hypothetical protein B7X02_00185 [Rhodospirillales bacterium 12-54-5]|nr:MAG: hypothetical protein B7X02_00185 [Rhodospirillales bacterium 12-54-5]
MANALVTTDTTLPTTTKHKLAQQEFVTLRLGNQLFGISVMAVQDVMRKQPIASIPLAPSVIAGSLNVRGRIVTALNMRKLLGLGDYPHPETVMKVVVEHNHELYALMIDSVGDVMALPIEKFEKVPANLDPAWRGLAAGVFKLEHELLIILDVGSVIARILE